MRSREIYLILAIIFVASAIPRSLQAQNLSMGGSEVKEQVCTMEYQIHDHLEVSGTNWSSNNQDYYTLFILDGNQVITSMDFMVDSSTGEFIPFGIDQNDCALMIDIFFTIPFNVPAMEDYDFGDQFPAGIQIMNETSLPAPAEYDAVGLAYQPALDLVGLTFWKVNQDGYLDIVGFRYNIVPEVIPVPDQGSQVTSIAVRKINFMTGVCAGIWFICGFIVDPVFDVICTSQAPSSPDCPWWAPGSVCISGCKEKFKKKTRKICEQLGNACTQRTQ